MFREGMTWRPTAIKLFCMIAATCAFVAGANANEQQERFAAALEPSPAAGHK